MIIYVKPGVRDERTPVASSPLVQAMFYKEQAEAAVSKCQRALREWTARVTDYRRFGMPETKCRQAEGMVQQHQIFLEDAIERRNEWAERVAELVQNVTRP